MPTTVDKARNAVLNPTSIAVIGASGNRSRPGSILLANIAEGGYRGTMYAVNPRAEACGEVAGVSSLSDIPVPVDVVFVVIRRSLVADVVAEAASRKVPLVCVVSGGFAESDEEGAELQQQLRQIVEGTQTRIIGPNTIGFISAEADLFASFVRFPKWRRGNTAIVSQTGLFVGALMADVMRDDLPRLAVSLTIDVGNKVDWNEADFLKIIESSRGIDVVGLHLEAVDGGAGVLNSIDRLRSSGRSVVLLNPGSTATGREASRSHTGRAFSEHAMVRQLMAEAGVLQVSNESEFVDVLSTLQYSTFPRSARRIAVVTYSGALGVIAADLLDSAGLDLAVFDPDTQDALARVLPEWQAARNPLDMWISVEAKPNCLFDEVLPALVADSNIDLVLLVILAEPHVRPSGIRQSLDKILVDTGRLPLAAVVFGEDRGHWISEMSTHCPVYADVATAVHTVQAIGANISAK